MNTIKNIYKDNLNLLINRKPNEIIKYDSYKYNNLLKIDNTYYSYYLTTPCFKTISQILENSFNKHFILISIMNNMKLLSSQDYNELNYNEYKSNIIKFIETSIDGLNRLIIENINNKELYYLKNLKNNCEKQLELVKTSNIDIKLKHINILHKTNLNSNSYIISDSDSDSDDLDTSSIDDITKNKFNEHFSNNEDNDNDDNDNNEDNDNDDYKFNFLHNIYINIISLLSSVVRLFLF